MIHKNIMSHVKSKSYIYIINESLVHDKIRFLLHHLYIFTGNFFNLFFSSLEL